MDFTKYFLSMPSELMVSGEEKGKLLLKLYAFNAYFGGDIIRTDEVINGCTYRRDKYEGIDGVYINEELEEDTIECVHSIYVGYEPFPLTDIYNELRIIAEEIDCVRKQQFIRNKEADELLGDYLKQSENNKIIIRIITDYTCDPIEKYEITKKIEAFDVSIKNFSVLAVIYFGDDIENIIESNKAPFDYVEQGKLIIDQPNNYLKYEDHSVVCNISAKSLKTLWEKEGGKGLLAMNLRYYIKSKNIDNKIEESIQKDNADFWYLNNGIIIVCNDFDFHKNELRLRQFSIVNGGQTSRMIGTIPFGNDFYICCKVIKNIFNTPQEKNAFIAKVAEASNTQKPIKAKDIIANRIEQRNLKSMFSENNAFIEIKRGEKCNNEVYKEPWQRSKNNELAQDLYSFVYLQPGPARNSLSKILENNEKYNTIFVNHKYDFNFLRDIIFLEKSFREYQKKISKAENNNEDDAIKIGLVKNGLYYTLAVIGYILKLNYNKQFVSNMQAYRNIESKFMLYSQELAFMHGFIDRNLSYKEFKSKAFDLFDFIYTNLIIREFKIAKDSNPTLSYSNWLKTDTGFGGIIKYINMTLFNLKDNKIIKCVAQYFVSIGDDVFEANKTDYMNYCEKNKKIVSKNFDGFVMSDEDASLRNDLMVYRTNYSINKHIAESRVFGDKALDKLVITKPVTENELRKIIGSQSFFYCGKDLLDIIRKHL